MIKVFSPVKELKVAWIKYMLAAKINKESKALMTEEIDKPYYSLASCSFVFL